MLGPTLTFGTPTSSQSRIDPFTGDVWSYDAAAGRWSNLSWRPSVLIDEPLPLQRIDPVFGAAAELERSEPGLLDRFFAWMNGNVTIPLMTGPVGQAVGGELQRHSPTMDPGEYLVGLYTKDILPVSLFLAKNTGPGAVPGVGGLMKKAPEVGRSLREKFLDWLKSLGMWALVLLGLVIVLFLGR